MSQNPASNSSLSAWGKALRPRTLFLAFATAITGNALAFFYGKCSVWVGVLTVAIATILQLLSNLANDLGDFEHGTDTTGERVGPKRTVQSGLITPRQMKKAIFITITIACIVGALLVMEALEFMQWYYILLFLLLGALSIVAAIKYTSGKNPYGYKGLGDVFSFVFFGPVAIVGTFFLNTHSLSFMPWLPAIGIGFLTICVLNINNMRDMDNDRKSGKITIPVRIGFANAKRYHACLTMGALVCFVAFNLLYNIEWIRYVYLLSFIPLLRILVFIVKTNDKVKLDPYLRWTSMSTFLLAVLFAVFLNF